MLRVLRALHAVRRATDANLEDRIAAVLQVGCDALELPIGLLTRVSAETWEIRVAAPPAAASGIGELARPLAEVPCARVVDTGAPLVVVDPDGDALKPLGWVTYAGAPVMVGGQCYGTLAFGGPNRRQPPLDAMERELLGMLALWVGDDIWGDQTVAALRRTEREQAQARRLEALGRLAGGIAHDFGNIVSGIATAAEILVERLQPDDPTRRFGAEIRTSAARARDLVEQLLVFAGARRAEARRASVDTIAAGAETMLRRLLRDDVELEFAVAPDIGGAGMDRGVMDRTLVNLALNAQQAMPDGGTLSVRLRRATATDAAPAADEPKDEEQVLIEVTDTGVGMDEETQARLFDPFFTTTPRGGGTGLGLSTVYALVHAAGGHIDVESAPGAGSVFRILLPVLGPPAPPRPESPVVSAPLSGAALVVDNDTVVRTSVAEALRSRGMTVYECADAAEARALVGAVGGPTPDLLVSDVVMPGTDGRALASELRQRFTSLAVVLMSGYAEPPATSDPAGNSCFLQKPFATDELLITVRAALGTT